MGFNKRRMESERAAVAAKEAAARRALGRQILEDAEHLIATWNARQGGAHAHAVLSDDRRSNHGSALVLVGVLSGLPHYAIGGPTHARSAPRRSGDKCHSVPVMPLVPA
jgi:hypothetical protein